MAKRILSWSVEGNSLFMSECSGSEDLPDIELEVFNLDEIYPDFSKMSEVQKFLIVYGLKQKLADCGASMKTATEKAEKAVELWERFLNGETSTKKVSANAEDKKLLGKIKKASGVVSLEGLVLKKITNPEKFTKQDQEKLDEFLAIVAKSKKSKKS